MIKAGEQQKGSLVSMVKDVNPIMDAALDAIICIDKKGAITYWNPQAEKIFGWKEKEVLGLDIAEVIVPPIYRGRHNKGMERYNQTGFGPALNVLLELSAVNKVGKEFPIELTVLPINEEEEEYFFCAFIRDISARKKHENELIKLSERLLYSSQATSDAIWDWDIREGTMYRSEGYRTLYGYNFIAQKWPEGFWESKVHPEDLGGVQIQIQQALDNPSVSEWTGEYRFLRANGEYAFVKEKIIILREQQGTPIRIIGALQDITYAKQQEQALRQERDILRAIIDNVPEYVYVKDRDLKHIINNKANLSLLGAISEEEALGKTASDYFSAEIAGPIDKDDRQVMETGEALYDREEVVQTPGGERRRLLTTKVALRDENNQIIGIAGISRDII